MLHQDGQSVTMSFHAVERTGVPGLPLGIPRYSRIPRKGMRDFLSCFQVKSLSDKVLPFLFPPPGFEKHTLFDKICIFSEK